MVKTLDASKLGIAGTFDSVTDGTLSFGGLLCAYSSADSSSTLWVCEVGKPVIYRSHSLILAMQMIIYVMKSVQ